MNKLIYFKLEIKRTLKLIPSILLGAAALSIVIGAVAFCASKIVYSTSLNDKKNIVFVSKDKSNTTNLIIKALKNSKSINSVCNINETDYDTALNITKRKEAIASVIVPKGFMHSLLVGTNYSIQIVFSPDPSIYSLVLSELCKSAELTLRSAQSGIYTLYDCYDQADELEHEPDANAEINMIYLSKAFARDNTYHENTVSATGNLDIKHYYIASGIMVVLLLLSCIFIIRFKADSKILLALYRKYGISSTLQILSRVISVFITLILIFWPVSLIISYVTHKSITVDEIAVLTCNSFLICLFVTSYIVLMCTLFTNRNSALFMSFLSTIVFCFISGAFIPTILLPDIIQTAGNFLPFKYLLKTIGSIYDSHISNTTVWVLLSFTLGICVICILLDHMYSICAS